MALTRSAVKGLQDEIEDVRLESVGLATRLGPEVGEAGDQPLSARVDTLETDGQTQKFSNFLSAIAGDFTQEEVTMLCVPPLPRRVSRQSGTRA